ncbi:hypothetical protein ACFLUU_05000 [Chloroflexota bacterium]
MTNKGNNKMLITIETLVAVAILAIVFYTGTVVDQPTFETQTVIANEPEVEACIVERTTVQYVDRPVYTVEYIERVKKVSTELRNFSNLEELKQWLEDRKNVTTIRFQSPNTVVDCDDYALEMQHGALRDGYIVSFEIIGESEYNELFTILLPPSQSLHAINLAIIGNNAYYIEPQTDEVVFIAYLD